MFTSLHESRNSRPVSFAIYCWDTSNQMHHRAKAMEVSNVSLLSQPDMESSSETKATSASFSGSSAYQHSMRIAKESGRWQAPSSDNMRRAGQIGLKTLLTISFLVIAGLILLLTGLVFFFSSREGTDDKKGYGMIIVAAIILVPGLWGAVNWWGTHNNWNGFSYEAFSLD